MDAEEERTAFWAGGVSMRIAMILSTALPPREGLGIYAWNLSNCLRELGHEVQFITRGGHKKPQREVVDGFTVWRPSFYPIYPFHVHLHRIFLNRLVQQLESEIDLFHVHSPLPPVISVRRPVMLTVHSSVWNDMKTVKVGSLNQLMMKLQAPISYQLENQLLKRASAVNVVSTEMATVLQSYPGYSTEISVNWNGVDTQVFSSNGHERQGYVLTTGRLSPVKGLEDLVDAARIVNQQIGPTRFLIAGEGPMYAMLKKKIASAGLQEQMELIGHVSSREQLARLYQQAALFVSPSHAEGLPTVLLEAMASECPVVATRVGGNSDVITDGENGILVPSKNPNHLANAICDLLSSPIERARMGKAGRKTIEQKFSWEAITKLYVDQYQKLLARASL
jgi:glycosyltransferase involved in cell wall biosynthesis